MFLFLIVNNSVKSQIPIFRPLDGGFRRMTRCACLGRFSAGILLLASDGGEEFVCIRPASGHSDETGVQLPVGFLRLTRAFRGGSVLVYAVLGEKVRTDMQDVVDRIRRGRNPSQILQFLIQLFQVEIRQTDIPDAFRCLFRIPAQAAFQCHPPRHMPVPVRNGAICQACHNHPQART